MCTSSATLLVSLRLLFFFNDTATTEIYTLSLHDALPIYHLRALLVVLKRIERPLRLIWRSGRSIRFRTTRRDRKSTRLNSSHLGISYAVFCLKKKQQNKASTSFTVATRSRTPSLPRRGQP